VTRFWGIDPNHTSVKIKITQPVYSFTTTLDPQHYSTTQGWF